MKYAAGYGPMLGVALAFSIVTAAGAQDRVWNQPTGGSFGSPFNWTPIGVPALGDRATFPLAGSYTVTFSGNEECDDLYVQNGIVTFDTASIPWDLTLAANFNINSGGLNVTDTDVIVSGASQIRQGSTVNLLDRGTLSVGSLSVGLTAAPLDSLNVFSATARLEGSILTVAENGASAFFSVCDEATAEIDGAVRLTGVGDAPGTTSTSYIAAGGTLTADFLVVGTNAGAGSSGELFVQGTGSTINLSAALTIGGTGSGTGRVTVSTGGVFNLGSGNNRVNTTGTLDLDGGTLTLSYIEVRGGVFTADGDAVIDVSPNGIIRVTEGGTMDWDQSLDASTFVFDPITYLVESGGLFEVASSCTLGNGVSTKGIVRVDGGRVDPAFGPGAFVPSTLRAAGGGDESDLRVGVDGDGELCITNGGRVQFGDDGVIGHASTSEATVIVNGEDAASGTASTLDLSSGGPTADLTVGFAGLDARLEITDGGRVLVGGDVLVGTNSFGYANVFVSGGTASSVSSELVAGDDLFVGGSETADGGPAVLQIVEGGCVTVTDTMRVYEEGFVTIQGGSLAGQVLDNRGRIDGSDPLAFASVVNTGSLYPGFQGFPSAPGDLDVGGDLVLAAGGELRIDIFDITPGGFDTLGVAGSIALGGSLVVGTPSGFEIPSGSSFDIIEAPGPMLDDTFDEIVPPPGYAATIDIVGDFVRLTLDAICPGDLDASGDVGFGDLLAVLSAWGPCPAPCPEDMDGDGAVGFADLLDVLSAWGPCP